MAEIKKPKLWPAVVLLTLLAIVLTLQHYALGIPLEKVLGDAGLITVQIFGAIGILVLGFFLYFFRCRWQYSYGFVELVVGFLATIYSIGQIAGAVSGRFMVGFAVAASLYVIARGLDNMHRGMNPEDKEAWEKFFYGKEA